MQSPEEAAASQSAASPLLLRLTGWESEHPQRPRYNLLAFYKTAVYRLARASLPSAIEDMARKAAPS